MNIKYLIILIVTILIINVDCLVTIYPTLFSKYSWFDGDSMVFYGNHFSYGSGNSIFINSQEYIVSPASMALKYPGYDQVLLSDSLSFAFGDKLNVYIQVNGQQSATTVFYYFKTISMFINSSLNDTGGVVTFTGSFTSVQDITTLTINGSVCTINSISTTSINFNYPPLSSDKSYELILVMGGLEFTTNVNYIATPTASSEQSSSSDNSSSYNSSSNSSSSNDSSSDESSSSTNSSGSNGSSSDESSSNGSSSDSSNSQTTSTPTPTNATPKPTDNSSDEDDSPSNANKLSSFISIFVLSLSITSLLLF